MASAVEDLESDFAALHRFAGAVAVGFGRAALRLALEAVEVRGSDVLVPDFVCDQVPEAVRRAGGRPVAYEITEDLGVLPDAFRAALTPATRGAIAVHYFGRPLPSIGTLAQICRERRVPLIEDCALALGAEDIGANSSASVFSLTKSDWCHGGGLLTSRSPELLARARDIRESSFQPAPGLALCYGLVRRADFLANRPARSRGAEVAGRALETLSRFPEESFYDAGRFDTVLPGFAARRARRLLAELPSANARRRRIVDEICDSLGTARRVLFRPDACPKDCCSFLLLKCEAGNAHSWREQAARDGVTLRLCWPAYQDEETAHASPTLEWLAAHLLLMEVHPNMAGREVQRIVRCLRTLAEAQPV